MNASHFLQAAIFLKYIPVDDPLNIIRSIRKIINVECFEYSTKGCIELLNALEFEYNCESETSPFTRSALDHFISDCRDTIKNIDSNDILTIEEESNVVGIIDSVKEKIFPVLEELGFQLSGVDVYCVDKFPGVFSKRKALAMNLDRGDQENHGVKPGIYILRDEYVPIFGRTVIAHEYIHTLFSDIDPRMSARSLEEGICEFLGTLYLGMYLLPRTALTYTFIYTRLREKQDAIWNLYLDTTRQAKLIYDRQGIQGICDLIKGGRKALKKAEGNLYGELFELDRTSSPPQDNTFTNLTDFLLMAFAPSMTVSSQSFKLSKYIRKGISIRELSALSGMGHDEVVCAIKELSRPTRIASLNADETVVVSSDAEYLTAPFGLRYRVLS